MKTKLSTFLAFVFLIIPLIMANGSSWQSTTILGNGIQANTGAQFNITRVFNGGDVFSNADPRCEPKSCQMLGASVVRSSPCHCQCPATEPAFLQHIRQCSNSIEECRMLEFNGTVRQRIPTVFLPLNGQNIATSSPIDWDGAGIRMDANGTIPCTVSGGGYLTQNGWSPLDNYRIFSLLTISTSGHSFLQWLGNKQDQLLLTGKVVQVTFRCIGIATADFCSLFRVIGKDAGPLGADSSASSPQLSASIAGANTTNERANQLGLIIGIVCGALLAVTLVSVAVFWTVCWKQQKERLARKIQLHVLYQQQRMQQQAAAGAFPHLANAFNAMNEPAVSSTIEMLQGYGGVSYSPYLECAQQQCWMDSQQQRQNEELARHYMMDQRGGLLMQSNSNGGMIDPRSAADQLILPPPPPYPHSRKKLYFSPEFFEPDLMIDPPPVAEEFLYEVRRMIDLAKNRIRSRRYVPSLIVISEEGCSDERRMSDASAVYSGNARSHSLLERGDSFSKMAQEPAPQETLSIQELEHEREHADSPRSASDSADSQAAASSQGEPPSSSSGDGGGGDRSSGEAISGGTVSVDSGLGDEESSLKAKKANSSRASTGDEAGGDKVTHWLSRLPATLEIDETELTPEQQQSTRVRHSKLYDYFNARQRLAQNHKLDRLHDEENGIIRVQVNEDMSTSPNSPSMSTPSASMDTGQGQYKRRYSVPLIDSAGLGACSVDAPDHYWQYRRPEIAALAPASAYFERLRTRQQKMDTNRIGYGSEPTVGSSTTPVGIIPSGNAYYNPATSPFAASGSTQLASTSANPSHDYLASYPIEQNMTA